MGIGKRIKQAREAAGLKQKDLAGMIGVTASAIANYENDVSHPKEPVLYALLDALSVDANFLFQDCVSTPLAPRFDEDSVLLLNKFQRLDAHSKRIVLALIDMELERS